MPGVSVTTDVRIGAGGGNPVPSSTFFVVGTAERGPLDKAVLVTSTAQFERVFGKYNASYTLHQSVRTFFEEGGTRCYVARAQSGGTAATAELDDITVTAVGRGAAYNNVDIVVSAGNLGSSYRLAVWVDGERYWKSGDLQTVDAMVSALNTNVGYLLTATASGGDIPSVDTYSLAGGVDPSGETAEDFCVQLDAFGYDLGTGAVAVPSQALDAAAGEGTVADRLISHCAANNRIALLSGESSWDPDDIKDAVSNYYGTDDTDRASVYYPWVKIPDGVGGTFEISPEAYVAGVRARAHTEVGPWKPGAGTISVARYVTDLAIPAGVNYDRSTADDLDDAQINTLRFVANTIRVYGVNTISPDTANWRFNSYRDTVNYIVELVEDGLEQYVFTPIDARGGVLSQIEATTRGILDPLTISGGLYPLLDADGIEIDPGYSVIVNGANNTQESLSEGKINVTIGLRVAAVSEMINVTIYKSGLTSPV